MLDMGKAAKKQAPITISVISFQVIFTTTEARQNRDEFEFSTDEKRKNSLKVFKRNSIACQNLNFLKEEKNA